MITCNKSITVLVDITEVGDNKVLLSNVEFTYIPGNNVEPYYDVSSKVNRAKYHFIQYFMKRMANQDDPAAALSDKRLHYDVLIID